MSKGSKSIKKSLRQLPWKLRINTLKSLKVAGSGHVGPCLSMAEILTALFFGEMNLNEDKNNSDFFVLSKGHGVPILYAVFEELGWLEKDELSTLRQIDSRLQGHPDRTALNCLDAGSGALGQGLSISIGYALSQKIRRKDLYSYCLLGDGEMQEGQIWEGIMYAGVKKLKNLCVFLDNNKFQNETSVSDTLGDLRYESKLMSFGWNYISVDGHSVEDIKKAVDEFKLSGYPTLIDAHTVKGKGVDFMEGNNSWHSKVLGEKDFYAAVAQCENILNDIN